MPYKNFGDTFIWDDLRAVPDMLAEDDLPESEAIDLIVKGESIVVVKVSAEESKIVVFKPTMATIASVKKYEHETINLMLDDACGLFAVQRPQAIMNSFYQSRNNVLLIDTVDLNIK